MHGNGDVVSKGFGKRVLGEGTMQRTHRQAAAVLAIAGMLGLTACGGDADTADYVEPAKVEEVSGSELSHVILTPDAAKRLDIKTAAIRRLDSRGGEERLAIPYAAVYYQPDGSTWAYVSLKPLTFVRQKIVVEQIQGDTAVLAEGPAPGTKVATVGVAELFGVESGLDGSGH
jgi:hypothetical protein